MNAKNWGTAVLVLGILAGCASHGAKTDQPAAATAEEQKTPEQIRAEPYQGTPAPGSKFAKLKMGMSPDEVTNLIGQPTSQSSHVTGKAWIPFYFGGDKFRLEMFYKGEGQLTFSQSHSFGSGTELSFMLVDTNATGYEPKDPEDAKH